jgi:hypothetical protein
MQKINIKQLLQFSAYDNGTALVSPPNLQGWKIDNVEISKRLLVQVGYSQV